MGNTQSTLTEKGYVVEKCKTQPGMPFGATKDGDTFIIKMISSSEIPTNPELKSELEILKISHPHIVNSKNSFTDEGQNTHYIVTDYCHGGNLAAKIKEWDGPPKEFEVLGWITEICMALKTIHEKGLFQQDLTPEDIHFTEFGMVCLSGYQKIYENSKNMQSATKTDSMQTSYLAPEVYTEGTYNAKSDIWSVGCILYELCTKELAFSAESTLKLIPQILSGPYPTLTEQYSPELCDLLNYIFRRNPQSRPSASDILACPFVIRCLSTKTKTTVEELQTKLGVLRALADGLERVHQGTTIGSLTGGVIGVVGGITSIVGLILAPFTLGASLIVTGVGVGVGAVGGVTAGASNITNMVNQACDRKAVQSIIKEIEQKIYAVVTWLQELNNGLQTIRDKCFANNTEGSSKALDITRIGLRATRSINYTAEFARLVTVMNIGRTAAQASRVVRALEVAGGVLSGLFVAVDIFFIAMDAKEIHNIRKAKAEDEVARSESASNTETNDKELNFDKTKLVVQHSKPDTEESQNQDVKPDTEESQKPSSPGTTPVIIQFVRSIRQAADDLQKVVDELSSFIPSLGDDRDLE